MQLKSGHSDLLRPPREGLVVERATAACFPPFDQLFDVVVVGSGYAGFSAAMTLQKKERSVLLIGSRGDLLWESSRAFLPYAGEHDEATWKALVDAIDLRGGRAGQWLDGAVSEVVATDQLLASRTTVLYYAQPVAVEWGEGGVTSLCVATKSGLHRVAGRQWIDATESGELARLVQPGIAHRPAERTHAYLMLQHPDWPAAGRVPGLLPTAWPTERALGVELRSGDPAWREQILLALDGLEELLGSDISKMSMSHLSIEPVSSYGAGAAVEVSASNVTTAVPGFSRGPTVTLADRFDLGLRAVDALGDREVCHVTPDVLSRPLPRPAPVRTLSADVCVVGSGTGGSVAALAAASAGADVICLEPLPFAGGIGTGGGIHGYGFGVPGGLQQEVDRRTRELMRRWCSGPLGDGPFNPWAKMIALEQMMREYGVDLQAGALLFDVEKRDDRVTAALAATAAGILRVESDTFIEGTGDGDLCAFAGAAFSNGRLHDGLLHAYTQSAGVLRELHGRPRMRIVNFDSGFCDPTDPQDLTRARLAGVRQYLVPSYDNFTRPTYIAPAIGIRQSRQVITEYVLTLDDQIQRRRFNDPVGYTGAFVENHATDYQFGSDEALFWVWANRQWTAPVACELSYRMLLPRGLSNVWIARGAWACPRTHIMRRGCNEICNG